MKTYDPAKNLFSFSGNLITGFAPDTFIKASRNSDGFTLTKGASGEGARSKSNDRSGIVELTLLSSSQSNDILAAIAAADELAGTGTGSLYMKEFNGTARLSGRDAWVKKQPDMERGAAVGNTVWTIEVDDLEMFNGGLL